MILLVDAGNSCLKWAVLEEGALQPGGRILRGKKTIKDVLAEAWDTLDAPDEVIIANVAGDAFRRALTAWIKKRWEIKPQYLSAEQQQLGVSNSYAKPDTLGVDRWLAMLGAYSFKKAPLCVIDCGTAITVDVIDRNGQHKGGLIMPGMHLMRQSLVDAASGIKEQPTLSEAPPRSFLAADTGNAIIVGTLYAAIAAIDRIVGDIRAEMGNQLVCYITGGEAELFLPLIDNRIRHEPDLVFKGMQAVVQASQPGVEDRPEEIVQAGDESKSSAAGKPKKKTRPRKKSRASKESKPDETVQAGETDKPDEVNEAREAEKPDAENQTGDVSEVTESNKPEEASPASEAGKPGEESDINEANKPDTEGDKAREQAL